MKIIWLLTVAALTLAACSSSSKAPLAPTNAHGDTVTAFTGPARPTITYGSPVSAVMAALGCTDPRPRKAAAGPGFNAPTADVVCTFHARDVEVGTWASQADEQHFLTTVGAIEKSYNQTTYVVVGTGWTVGTAPDEHPHATKADKELADAVASTIGGQVRLLGS